MALHRRRIAVEGDDPGVGVGGGFADGEVLRARGDIRVCLAKVVGYLEAIGRHVGKGGHLRETDVLPHAHGVARVLVGAKNVDVRGDLRVISVTVFFGAQRVSARGKSA